MGRAPSVGPMSHPHAHGGPAPASRGVVGALTLVMSLFLVATLVGVVALWPSDSELPAKRAFLSEGSTEVSGRITAIDSPGDVSSGQSAQVRVRLDSDGTTVEVPMGATLVTPDIIGARVRLVQIPAGQDTTGQDPDGTGTGTGTGTTGPAPSDTTGSGGDTSGATSSGATSADPSFMFMDFHRSTPLVAIGLVLALAVIAVARWKGAAALVGLVAALATIWYFTLPALLAGKPSVLVALTTASAILFIVVYLAHGVSVKSSTALLGTFAGIAVVTVLASWAIPASHLTPGVDENMSQLAYLAAKVDIRGVLLCGMVLSGVGVLNDVTITQASSVWELRAAAPSQTRWSVFTRAMRIGRDHIASTVYTIAFAYAGGALGLLMLASTLNHSLLELITYDDIAEELVGIGVASIGLVLAIPLTTAIAALLVGAPRPAEEADARGVTPSSRPQPRH